MQGVQHLPWPERKYHSFSQTKSSSYHKSFSFLFNLFEMENCINKLKGPETLFECIDKFINISEIVTSQKVTFVRVAIPLILCIKLRTTLSATTILCALPVYFNYAIIENKVKREIPEYKSDMVRNCIILTMYFAKLQPFVYTITIFSVPHNLMNTKMNY